MPIIGGGQSSGGGAISGVTVTGTAASGQVPVASSAAAGVWAYPPGFEINYTQITAPVNVVSTTEATGTTIISPGALTFDGTAVLVQCFTPVVTPNTTTATVRVCLFEGATQITRLSTTFLGSGSALQGIIPVMSFFRFTPTAAAHTYTVTAFASSTAGTPSVVAGPGGTGGEPPAFIRFVKA